MISDMTVGKPLKAITLFAIPLFIGNIFQQIYNVVDSIIVGNFVGPTALAAVGACSGAFALMIALINGLTSGMSVVIAQFFGAKNDDKVRKSFVTSMMIIMLIGLVVTVLGIFLSRPLLLLLNTPEEILDMAQSYLIILFIGTLATCLYNGVSSVLRALGNSLMPLLILIFSSLINVVLDLLFVLVFKMGVRGVGMATVMSQLISGLICLIYIFYKIPFLRFGKKDIRVDTDIVKEISRIGFPSALSSCGVSISMMFMQRAVNSYGTQIMAGYTISGRAESVCMCLSFAIGIAVGTFCGQNIGARDFDRVKKGLHVGYAIAIAYSLIVSAVLLIFGRSLAGMFTTDTAIIDIAKTHINVSAYFAPVLCLVFVFQNFLRSAGDVTPTVWMSVLEIIARSALSFLFSYLWGYIGIWWATPVGWSACLLVGYIRYRSGVWKKKAQLA